MKNNITLPLDSIGIIASTLCLIHCIGTPFLFIAKACSTACCADTPLWWQVIDYLFLIISFAAIYFISKNLTIQWLKILFWISWIILLMTILNHTLNFVYLPKNFIYIPSALIIIFHFYHLKFCNCTKKGCCVSNKL